MSECFMVCFIISWTLPVFSRPQGPPRVSERVAHRQSVRLGRTMKLPCPVEGDPPPLIMWTKDGRNIHSGWTRFRVLQHALRIKEVETDDAGTYICKATNGFGSVNINYTLIIIGKWNQKQMLLWHEMPVLWTKWHNIQRNHNRKTPLETWYITSELLNYKL